MTPSQNKSKTYQHERKGNASNKNSKYRFSKRVFTTSKTMTPAFKRLKEKESNSFLLYSNEMDKMKYLINFESKLTLDNIDRREQEAKDSEKLKEEFKTKQATQPRIKQEIAADESDEAKVLIKKRATELQEERFQGAQIANQIILASKCHAIRDAQIREKGIIKQMLHEESKRLDEMMEKARVDALDKELKEYNERKARRLENINVIKQQIVMHEKEKLSEKNQTNKELNKLFHTGTELQRENEEKSRMKKEKARELLENLNKCREELESCKQKQWREDKVMEERIKRFIELRRERDSKLRDEDKVKKQAREKIINYIAKAQETAKKHREEMENIRILKVQEDVEREYRAKEKALLIKKIDELKKLKEGREKQVADIRRQMAVELARNEETLKDIIKKNNEEALKEEEKTKAKKESLRNHRRSIIKQINENERKRIESKKIDFDEGIAMKMKFDEIDNMEKSVVKRKVDEMREQKIPDPYISEVVHQLSKLKYYDN